MYVFWDMKAMTKTCYDCGAPTMIGGVTVGRMSCDTIWTTICAKCASDFKKRRKVKKAK